MSTEHLAPHVAPAPAPCGTEAQPIGGCGCRLSGGCARAPLAMRYEQDRERLSDPPMSPRAPLPGLQITGGGARWPGPRGGHVGQPEKMERAPHKGPPNPSCPVSEGGKDSGFSGGSSECLSALEQKDTEDPVSLPSGIFPGGLTPLYLIKNVVLEQTLGVPPTAPFLTWSNQSPLESARSSAARLFLLQQPSAQQVGFPTTAAPSPAAEPSRHKRFYVGEAWPSPEAPTAEESCEKPPEESAAGPQTSVLVRPGAPARLSLSCAGLHPAEGRTALKGARRPRGHSLARQRCLHSTVEILRRSGLLGITLRTKELLRQNSRTQRELAQLRAEAQLLCKAVRSNDSRVWVRLQDVIGLPAAP